MAEQKKNMGKSINPGDALLSKIRAHYAHDNYVNVISSQGDELLNVVNEATIQLALSNEAAQRLIAICELVRATSFKYSQWEKWYKSLIHDENKSNAIDLKEFISAFNITVIKWDGAQISMLSCIDKLYRAILFSEVTKKDDDEKEQLINDYSRYLCIGEIEELKSLEDQDTLLSAYIANIYSYIKKLYYTQRNKNVTVENELLQMLTPKRFRESSLAKDDFEGKNPFESDYFRIVTSAPIRRLQDKTQIFPQEKSDFVRRRLTHSMEVAAIGRHLGLMVEERLIKSGALFKDKDYVEKFSHSIATILETAGLVHDIGNPPFGHFGEDTIQRYFKELVEHKEAEQTLQAAQMKVVKKKDQEVVMSLTKVLMKERNEMGLVAEAFAKLSPEQKQDFLRFDGNVQGLRILRHLGLSTDHNSFNLTMPTMASIIKYPFPSDYECKNESPTHSEEKYGYYQSEKDTYEKICKILHIKRGKRHPLAYLLEAADDIVNVTSDVEDGCKMGIIGFDELRDEINALGIQELHFDTIKDYEKDQAKNGECSVVIPDELLIKEFRIRAVHHLMNEAVDMFVLNIHDIIHDSFAYEEGIFTGSISNPLLGNDLLMNSRLRKALSKLQKETYQDTYVLKSELLGEHVITEMLDRFIGCMLNEDVIKKEVRGECEKLILKSKSAEGKLYALISSNYKRAFDCEKDEVPLDLYHRFLLAVDHVSGMTDSYIVDLYNELTNRKR